MNQRLSRLLNILLIVGGIPPMMSGIYSIFFADHYFTSTVANIPEMFDASQIGFLTLVTNFWGGDAFVAGAARVTAVFYGNLRLKLWLGAVAILHGLFELWLIPTRYFLWCNRFPEAACTTLGYIEATLFLLIHVSLIVGFSYVLFVNWRGRTLVGTN